MRAKCSCGHEFALTKDQFSLWHDECECCGATYHLEITCPACAQTFVLDRTVGEGTAPN